MYSRDLRHASAEPDLNTVEAEFVTDFLLIQGEISTPESRLSDHMNSSTTSVEIRPSRVVHVVSGDVVDLQGNQAQVTKAHLLYVVPLTEPEPVNGKSGAWTWTRTMHCWVAFGGYRLSGRIHAEAGRDARLIMRMLEQKQFLPLTEVSITHPSGETSGYGAVIVNRSRVEMLSLRDV